jgi:hypothetical protein
MNQIQPSSTAFELVRQVLRVDASFLQAPSLILNCHGRTIASGGLIGALNMQGLLQAKAI